MATSQVDDSQLSQTKKTAYHHGNLKQTLVDLAGTLLETEGLAQLSLRRLARAAGVSQTAPYGHFTDKTALLAAVATSGFQQLSQRMQEEVSDITEPGPQLHALAQGYVGFALSHPALFRLMFGAELGDFSAHSELQAAAAASYHMLETTVAACLTASAASSAKPGLGTVSAWALVHGLATLMLDGKITPERLGLSQQRDLIYQVAALLQQGLIGV
jgi:AcrR family transcriptional regulator